MKWYLDVLKKYAVFTGRARRTEYWMFILISLIISFVIGFGEGLLGSPGILYGLYTLAVLIPTIAVAIRRLHDTNRSGWWMFICLVPLVGPIIFLVFAASEGTAGENSFGPDPKAV